MKTIQTHTIITYIAFSIIMFGCHKKEYLNQKPVSNLKGPENLKDLQELLDNNLIFNEAPYLGDASADNYYLSNSSWQALSLKDQNAYIWARDLFMGIGGVADWNTPYAQVFYANVILQALKKIEKNTENQERWNTIQGSALFLRSNAFYELSQLFILPYDNHSAGSDMGLPLRLTDDVTERSVRSSVQQTYDQIISDISEAKKLLPPAIDTSHLNLPSKPAAMALLSKVYLSMRIYDSASVYADSCLKLHNQLLDYNTLNSITAFPFRINNPEILFHSQSSTNITLMSLISRGSIIDSTLYHSYDTNDLRRTLFYSINNENKPIIRSSYSGRTFSFTGLAVDEVLLIRAECLARAGNIQAALSDLNMLLRKRWKINTFVPFSVNSASDVLQLILTERRKELPFRNVRWSDLRRLNKEGMNIILTRMINGKKYELMANHACYVLPIPPDVTALSNIPQNPR